MPIEMNSDRALCSRCGTAYGRHKGNFPVSYAVLHKGVGYIPVCKPCIDSMYNAYLSQCNDAKSAVRQMCRKLDLFWSESVFEVVSRKNTPRSMMTQYIAKINSVSYAGKSYDDTLSAEGTLWAFSPREVQRDAGAEQNEAVEQKREEPENKIELEDIPEDIISFWGAGYRPDMYIELEQRRAYWMSGFPEDVDLDIPTEGLIRQICALEVDINRDRAAGRSVDKSVTVLNTLLGSANLKPVQNKQNDADSSLANTPLGVWLYRYENQRPLPEVDESLKDRNHIIKYMFTWMGHVLKMLGKKNKYTQMYEEEIARLSVEQPEYDGDDEEALISSLPDYDNDPMGAADIEHEVSGHEPI